MNNKNNFLYLYLVLAVFLSCLFININHKSTLEYNENKYTKDDKTTNVVGNDIKNIVYTDKIAVLTFHRVAEHDIKEKIFKDNEWVNDMEIFEQQMQYLYDNGYETLSSDEFYCWYKKECEFSKKTVLLTFDDGDAELYYNVLPILQKFNFKATAFIIGEYVKDITAPFDGITKNYIGRDLINEIQVVYPNIEFHFQFFYQ